MEKIGKILFSLLVVTTIGLTQAQAQVKVEASVEDNQVALGDAVTLTVSVNSDSSVNVTEPRIPNFAELELIQQSSGVQVKSSFANGQFKSIRSQNYYYIFRTLNKGQIDIPPLTVIVDGKEFKTAGIRIQVMDPNQLAKKNPGAAARGRQNEDPFGGDEDDIFEQLLQRRGLQAPNAKPINPEEAFSVRLITDKTQVYAGEQITASYYIYWPQGVQLTSLDNVKFPSLKGFWKEDIEVATRLNAEPVVINGKRFNRALLTSYALFPIKEGKAKIDSYKIKCGVSTANPFGFGKTYSYTKASDEAEITVLPLPEGGKPNSFTGAVGNFNITANVEGNKFQTGQPFSVKIKVEGQGNAKTMDLPPIDFPPALELFDKKEETKFFTSGQSFKEFTLFVNPKEVGATQFPAVEFTYFDPSKGTYVTKKTNAIPLTVAKGADNTGGSVSFTGGTDEAPKAEKPADVIRLPELLPASASNPTWKEIYNLYIFVALLLMSLLYLYFLARKQLGWSSREQGIEEKLQIRVKKLRKYVSQEDYRKVGVEGANAIYYVLSEIVGDEAGSEIHKTMDKLHPSTRKAVEEKLMRNLDILQALGFAPENMIGKYKEKKELNKTASEVEKLLHELIRLEAKQR